MMLFFRSHGRTENRSPGIAGDHGVGGRTFPGRCSRLLGACVVAALTLVAPARAAEPVAVHIDNKTEVWFVEDHTVPIVSFNISLPAGAGYDPAARPGLASFAAAMLDEGAGNLDSAAFQTALAEKAIQLSAHVDRDYLTISVTSLRENVPDALHLLQLALSHPRFDGEAVARVRAQIIQSLQQSEAEPPSVAAKGFAKAFFNGHVYGHAGAGEIGAIAAARPEELRAFARSHWVKGGMMVAVAGDIAPAQLVKLLQATFAPLPGAAPAPLPNVGKLGSPGVHVLLMPVPQPTIVFGLPGIMRADPAFIPGYVANYIVGGGGFSSRLTDEVRVKRGLTYGVTTALTSYRKASVMMGQVATRADAVHQTIQVVRDTLADFAANGPTQAELDDAKTFLTGSFPLAFASNTGTAAQLGTFQRQGLDIGYVARRNSLIQAVTLDQVRQVSRKLFDPSRMTIVVAGTPMGHAAPPGPKPVVRPAPLAPAAPDAVVKPGQAPPKPVQKPVAGKLTGTAKGTATPPPAAVKPQP